MGRRSAPTLVVLVVIASGCSLSTSLDGLSNGEREADLAGGSSDAGAEAEASPGQPDSGSGFCASLVPVPVYCNDFDQGQGGADGWTEITASIPGTGAATDTSASFSAPASLVFSVAATTLADGAVKQFRRRDTGVTPLAEARAEYKLRVDATDPALGIRASTLTFDGDAGRDYFYINVANKTLRLQEQFYPAGATSPEPSIVAILTQDFTAQAWHHVEIRVTVDPPRVSVRLDGSEVLAPRPVEAARLTGKVALSIGTTSYNDPNTPLSELSYRFDDFVVDAR